MAELTKLGRYELRRVLGKGAMGVVYEGYDPTLSRRVAVKTILKSFGLDAETEAAYAARFVQEAKAVARLNHPNIVQVYDFSVESEVAYLVMEFIEGRELRGHFSDGERFEPADVVRVMGELLDALDFAHEHGVIHRDVKPANVMLDAQRRVKLADFGVARIQDSERSAAGTMVGTPAFMSPEQISGGKIDRRTDIFSAGTILYQLLTGEQPFRGDGAWTVARQIMQDDPPTPSSVVRSVSPEFDAIVHTALAKKPSERYASAREFSSALRGALAPGAQAAALIAPAPKSRQEPKASETELEFWRALQNSNDAAEFEFYLEQFPEGTYAQLARHKIAKLRESQETVRWDAEEKAAQEAQARAKREADDKAIREALEKTKREAAERAKRGAEEQARRAQVLARLKEQEDATVAVGTAAKVSEPPAQDNRSVVIPAVVGLVVVAVGVGAYVISSRTPAPSAPVAQAPVVAKVEPPAPVKPEAPAIDVEKIRREAEERVRREYADRSAAEKAALEKAAAAGKAAAMKAAAEKAAAEKAAEAARNAAEKVASAKSAQERAALEKAAAIEKAAAERAAAAERTAAAAERAAAERVAAAEKAVKAVAEKAAEEKAAAAKAAEKAAAPAKTPPVSVAATAPAATPREAGLVGRFAIRLFAGSGGWPACDRIDVNEDIEIRAGSSQSISGRGFADLQFRSTPDGSVAATMRSVWTPFGSGDAKLSGSANSTGYAGTYDWRWSAISCAGKWTLVRKGN